VTDISEAVHTFETSVNFNVTTQRYIPEDSKLHTCHRENLNSQIKMQHENCHDAMLLSLMFKIFYLGRKGFRQCKAVNDAPQDISGHKEIKLEASKLCTYHASCKGLYNKRKCIRGASFSLFAIFS
jgi:hypothetical protein